MCTGGALAIGKQEQDKNFDGQVSGFLQLCLSSCTYPTYPTHAHTHSHTQRHTYTNPYESTHTFITHSITYISQVRQQISQLHVISSLPEDYKQQICELVHARLNNTIITVLSVSLQKTLHKQHSKEGNSFRITTLLL